MSEVTHGWLRLAKTSLGDGRRRRADLKGALPKHSNGNWEARDMVLFRELPAALVLEGGADPENRERKLRLRPETELWIRSLLCFDKCVNSLVTLTCSSANLRTQLSRNSLTSGCWGIEVNHVPPLIFLMPSIRKISLFFFFTFFSIYIWRTLWSNLHL